MDIADQYRTMLEIMALAPEEAYERLCETPPAFEIGILVKVIARDAKCSYDYVDNYNEIVLTEGFGAKDKFSESKKEYLKKINEQKDRSVRFLQDLLERNNLSKEDKIEKLFEALT